MDGWGGWNKWEVKKRGWKWKEYEDRQLKLRAIYT